MCIRDSSYSDLSRTNLLVTTLLVSHYVHTTCHNLQRHTEHVIRAYTAQWTQTAVYLSHRGRLSFVCSTSTSMYSEKLRTTCHNLRHAEHMIIPKPLPNSGKFLT